MNRDEIYELAAGYANLVAITAIAQVVCVSRHYARMCRERAGWPAGKVVTIADSKSFVGATVLSIMACLFALSTQLSFESSRVLP